MFPPQNVQIVLAVLFFATLLGILVWLSIRRSLRRGLVLRHPVVAVSDFPEGKIASVRGVSRAQSTPLRAPASGEECVFLRLELRFKNPRGGHSVILVEERGVDFAVDDGTGEALVRVPGPAIPASSSVDPAPKTILKGLRVHAGAGVAWSVRELGMERWEALVTDLGFTLTALSGGQRPSIGDEPSHYVQEWTVPTGTTVTVRGAGLQPLGAPPNAVELNASAKTPVDLVCS